MGGGFTMTANGYTKGIYNLVQKSFKKIYLKEQMLIT